MVQISILGATGRMGQELIELIQASNHFELCGASCANTRLHGDKVAGTSVSYSSSKVAVERADVAIDFSLPAAVEKHLQLCVEHSVAYVGGVTGLDAGSLDKLDKAAISIPVLWAPNMSIGVNTCFAAASTIASQLDHGFAVTIVDLHHAGKKDAPSGTALEFGRVIQSVANPTEIEYQSLREGNNPGKHQVGFTKDQQSIELHHQAGSRTEFAEGALSAATWIVKQPAGRYNMRNLLEIAPSA